MMAAIRNLKISQKILFFPLFVVLLTLGSGFGSLSVVDTFNDAFRETVDVNFAKSDLAATLASDLMAAHTALHRSIGYTAIGESAQRIKDIYAGFDAKLDTVAADLDRLARNFPLTEDEHALIKRISAGLKEARNGGHDVADMLAVDLVAAASFLKGYDLVFDKVSELVRSLGDDQRHQVAARQGMLAEMASATRTTFHIGTAIALLVLGLVTAVIIRLIAGPVVELTRVMSALARGTLGITIPAVTQRDEMGAMARAVEVFRENAERVERLTAEQAALKADAERSRRLAMATLAEGLERAVHDQFEALRTTTGTVDGDVGEMGRHAASTLHDSESVAEATDKACANVSTVAGAAGQLEDAIAAISGEIAGCSARARDAAATALATDHQVASLVEAVDRIESVVKLIHAIAEQTNLLALNATIEAARAGDAGKGFAVVAGEVKNLAKQTATATEEISTHIHKIQDAANGALGAIGQIRAGVIDLDASLSSVSANVGQQAAATQQIFHNATEAAGRTRDVFTRMSAVRDSADVTRRSVSRVQSAVGELVRRFQRLEGEIIDFIGRIRAD